MRPRPIRFQRGALVCLVLAMGGCDPLGCSKKDPPADGPTPPPVGVTLEYATVYRIRATSDPREHGNRLATALGMSDVAVLQDEMSTLVLGSVEGELVLHTSSGTFDYTASSASQLDDPETPVAEMDAATATERALAALADAEKVLGEGAATLLPPSPHIDVIDEGAAGGPPGAMLVRFTPTLPSASPSSASYQLDVLGGEVEVTIRAGHIDRIRSQWRPLESATTDIRARSAESVQSEAATIWTGFGALSLRAAYVMRGESDPQTSLAPVYLVERAVDASTPPASTTTLRPKHGDDLFGAGAHPALGAVQATTWSPSLAPLTDFATPFDAGAPMKLRLLVGGGNHDVEDSQLQYHIVVISDRQGVVGRADATARRGQIDCAGEGCDTLAVKSIPAGEVGFTSVDIPLTLGAGRHELLIAMVDHNGERAEGGAPIVVENGDKEVPARPTVKTIDEATTFDTGALRYTIVPGNTLYPPRAAPLLRKVHRPAWHPWYLSAVDSVEMEQWRYKLWFPIKRENGAEVKDDQSYLVYESGKCVSSRFPQGKEAKQPEAITCSACAYPTAATSGGTRIEYAVPSDPKPLRFEAFEIATDLPGDNARNQTSAEFRSDVSFANLPGKVEMQFVYRPVITMCAPSFSGAFGAFSSGATYLVGRRQPLGLGRCPGFVPEVRWRYSFPDAETSCGELKRLCSERPGACSIVDHGAADAPVEKFSAASAALIDALCVGGAAKTYPVHRADVDVYTRFGTGGERTNTTFVRDGVGGGPPTLEYTYGEPLDRSVNYVADINTYIPPIPQEVVGNLTYAKTAPATTLAARHYDNWHQKQVTDFASAATKPLKAALKTWVAFPGGNDLTDTTDRAPVFHMHERWDATFGPPYAWIGFDIRYIDLVQKAAERNPMVRPETLVEPEVLVAKNQLTGALGANQVLWVRYGGAVSIKGYTSPVLSTDISPPILWSQAAPVAGSKDWFETTMAPMWTSPK